MIKKTMEIKTAKPDFIIRQASIADCDQILAFIKELAAYENLSHEVSADKAKLEGSLFGEKQYAKVIIGEYKSEPVAFALYFHNFSTFLGKPGIYLEDLFVKPQMRSKGFGKIMLAYLAKLALDLNCGRLEWSVLNWNQPAIGFYQSLGAKQMKGWTGNRLSGECLAKLADQF
jgi:GNAT superfamily N-acetyltransferase